MNLAKAIELGEESERSLRDHKFIDHADALKLLIEAGKAYQKSQEAGWYPAGYKLLGETED